MTKFVKNAYDHYIFTKENMIKVYSQAPGNLEVMHKKGMLIDNSILMLGSVNLSNRSFYNDLEANFTFVDEKVIQSFTKMFKSMIRNSFLVRLDVKSSMVEKVLIKTSLIDLL
ncbi:MAG: phospholipase D-like domain-containing protein [Bacteriovorax sp.]|nr:phospholipase D-like domain-containing protein [Bacteriovorax sp.]